MKGLSPSIKRLILFLLILIGINEVARQYFYRVSVKNHPLIVREQLFYDSSKTELSALFMGHSRPLAGIDLSQLKDVSGFCSPGETNVQTYYKLKYLLEETNKEIDRVILPFGFGTFCHSKPEVLTHSWFWKKYIDYSELGSISNEYWNFLAVSIKSKIVPYYEYPSLRLRYHYDELNASLGREDFQKMTPAQKLDFSIQITQQQLRNKHLYSDASFQYLELLIQLAQANELELIFVKYPVSKWYQMASSEMIIDEKWEIDPYESLIEKNKIQYLNYNSLFEEQDSLFKDPQHLNEKGKAALTKRISLDLGL